MTSVVGPRPGERPAELTLYKRRMADFEAEVLGRKRDALLEAGKGIGCSVSASEAHRDPAWDTMKLEAARALRVPLQVEQPARQLTIGGVAVETQARRAFTVAQPFGWLLAHSQAWPDGAGKTSEIRTTATRHRGPVLVHVSSRWPGVVERTRGLRRQRMIGSPWPEPTQAELVEQLGKVVAIAELVGCRVATADDADPWVRLSVRAVLEGLAKQPPRRGEPTPTCWAWQLEDVRLIEPVTAEAKPGLWHLPQDIEIRERRR